MKRYLSLICGVCAAIALISLALIFTNLYSGTNFKDLYVSDDDWYKVTSSRLPKKDLEIGEIYFDDMLLYEDKSGQRLFYSVDPSDKRFSTNPKIRLSNGDIHIVSKESELDFSKIREGATIKLLAYNDSNYRNIELVLTTLPILAINTSDGNDITENDTDSTIELNDHGQITKSNSQMHIRGGYTRTKPKKAYKISLKKDNGKKNKVSLLGMRNDDDWILNSLYTDWEKVREIFATRLWRECCSEHNYAGADNSFEYRYVEVLMNGSYHGLYLLGYKPDKKVTEIKDGEIMFKNQSYSDLSDLRKNPRGKYYSIENDVEDTSAAMSELMSFLEVLERHNPAVIRDKFDIQNAIDYDLFSTITLQTDLVVNGKTKNLYLTVKEVDGKRFAMYTPWDFDFCFSMMPETHNRDIDPSSYVSNFRAKPKLTVFPVYILRNNGDKTIVDDEKARYAELRAGAWSTENIMKILDEYEDRIFNSGAYWRDLSRWPESEQMAGISDLSLFKEYMTKRLEYFDNYYKQLSN